MIKLNLPSYDYQLKRSEEKVYIFDGIRKKYILLTPEEWVRQHFIHYLTQALSYPRALLKIEGSLRYNTLQKRSDIVVYNRAGLPWMVVECKAPEVRLNEAVLRQAALYNDTLRAEYVVITNGMKHLCCRVDNEHRTIQVLQAIPTYP